MTASPGRSLSVRIQYRHVPAGLTTSTSTFDAGMYHFQTLNSVWHEKDLIMFARSGRLWRKSSSALPGKRWDDHHRRAHAHHGSPCAGARRQANSSPAHGGRSRVDWADRHHTDSTGQPNAWRSRMPQIVAVPTGPRQIAASTYHLVLSACQLMLVLLLTTRHCAVAPAC